jgi:hypothetical protein
MALINPARPPSRQEQEVRGCTTRIQERANNQIIAIKQNPKTAITVATGLVAAGASIAFPPLLPFAAGAAAAKFAWDALTKKENND